MSERDGKILTVSGYALCAVVACLLLVYALRPVERKQLSTDDLGQGLRDIGEHASGVFEIESIPPLPEQQERVPLPSEMHPSAKPFVPMPLLMPPAGAASASPPPGCVPCAKPTPYPKATPPPQNQPQHKS